MSRFLLRGDRAVQAGAGTGKTHALVTQYLHLCAGLTAQGRALEPRQIAAMTFTEKAAGEMIERIRGRAAALLLALGKGEEAAEVAEPDLFATARELGRPVPGAAHWERLLGQLGAAQVGTFHSFAGGLLRRYPAHSGVDPDFVMLDEDTARDVELEVTERQVLAALEGGGEAGLGPAEVAPLVAEYGFRGAAGGEALVEHLCRVRARRAEEGVGAEGLAAGYGEDAILGAFEGARGRLLHGLRRLGELAELLGDKSAALCRELAAAAGPLSAALRGLPEVPGALPLLDEILGSLGRLRGKRDDEGGAQALAEVKATLREARRDLEAAHHTASAAPLAQAFERLLQASWRAYDEAKARLGALDFTDLLRRARDLLRDHAAARAQLRDRFAVVLVDECQDTNPLQAELLLLLCGAPAERQGAPGRLYVVGDRKQSIYEFRGGDVATFQALQDAIVEAGGDEETLAVSRRSRPGVLRLANALFSQVMKVPAGGFLQDLGSAATPVPLTPQALGRGSAGPAGPTGSSGPSWPSWIVQWDPARDPLLPLRDDAEGAAEPAAELLMPARPPRAAPPSPAGAAGAPAAPGDEAAAGDEAAEDPDPMGTEAQLLCRHVLALREGGRRFGDMAVLLWRFTHLQRYLLALRQAGVPYYVVKGRGFYEAQEIRDLCAALTLLDDPEDVLALVSLLRSPLCGLSDDSLARLHLAGCLRLSALSRGEPPCPKELPAGEAERLGAAVRLLGALGDRGDRLGPAACLRAIYDESDLLPALCAGPEGPQRVANLELLQRRAEQFEEGGGGLRAFIRWLRLQCDPALPGDAMAPQAQIVSEQDDVVRVMTVHQSKGLEFPVVFIPGCSARERADVGAVGYDRDVGLGIALRRGGERHDTLPSLRVQQLRRLRAEAEAARLFYVAVTRARDRVVFIGQSRRPKASRGTWRAHLDALLESPEAAALLPRAIDLTAPAPTLRRAEAASEDEALAAAAAARAYDAAPPAAPCELTLSAAVDRALCPRRLHLRHALGLEEPAPPGEAPWPVAADEERGPADRLRLGTLAHRLLRRADLLGRGEDLEGLLSADGHDALQPQAAEIRTRAARLLQSPRFQALVASGSTRRALPFRLRAGPALLLRGQIDLLIAPPGAAPILLDLRYGYAPPRDEAEGLRRAALHAVGRAATSGPVRVGLAYLREADPSPVLSDGDEALEAAALARLDGAAGPREPRGPSPRLPLERCRALGCGFVPRCHGPGPGPGA